MEEDSGDSCGDTNNRLLELEYLINHSYLERFSAHKVKPYGNIAEEDGSGLSVAAEPDADYGSGK